VLDREAQRRLGAWYTPPVLVEHVLDEVLEGLPLAGTVRILDPACGDGRFLVAARARLGDRAELHGMDIDLGAVAEARRALGPAALVEVGDALRHPWDEPFDVVVGNPPFLNQLARRTTRGGRSVLGGGPYADTASLFLALALRVVRADGGRVGLVLPQSVLATRDTEAIRRDALAVARLESLWWAGVPVFDAAVHAVILTFTRGAPQGAVRRSHGLHFAPLAAVDGRGLAAQPTWSTLVADVAGVPPVELFGVGTIGDRATVVAGFRDQYYGLVGHVGDDGDGPPLVTVGSIDVGRCRWGERPVRFAKERFGAPRVRVDELEGSVRSWVESLLTPKIVVATQTRVIEAVVDEAGAWVPSVPSISIVPSRPEHLWRIGAALCSPALSAHAAARHLGAGLSATALKLSAAQVRALPWPIGSLDAAAARLREGDVRGAAREADRAYGVDDVAVRAWWEAGAFS
jgi:SAM-dependent methyltransferase